MVRKRGQNLWPFLVILAVALFFFWPLLFGNKIYLFSDLFTLHYPWKVFYSQSLSKGQLPLWAPTMGLGFPLLAEGEAGALYPFNLLLYYILPVPMAFNLSLFLHFFLSAVFMFFLARTLELSNPSALIAGISFAFSGFMAAHMMHLNVTTAMTYLPLIFTLLNLYFKNPKTLHLVGVAAAWALQFYAGAPQISFLTGLAATLYVLLPSLWKSIDERNFHHLRRDLIWGSCTVLLALLLSMGQLLPTYELTNFSLRVGGMNPQELTLSSLHPLELITNYFLPFFWHSFTNAHPGPHPYEILFWERVGYLGLIPLGLAFFSLGGQKSKAKIFFLGLLAFSWLMALGKFTPFYLWLAKLPGFNYFRVPARFLSLSTFALALLAGFGLERLRFEELKLKKLWPFFALLLLAAFLFLINRFRASPLSLQEIFPIAFFILFLLTLISYHQRYLRTPAFLGLTTLLLITDLFLLSFPYNPLSPLKKVEVPPWTVSFLQKEQESFRFLSLEAPGESFSPANQELLLSNYNIIYGLNNIISKGALIPRREYQLISMPYWGEIRDLDAYWGFFNVKYYLVDKSLELKHLQTQKAEEKSRIYLNPQFKPRTYLADKIEVLSREEDILKRMSSDEFLQGNILILEEKPSNSFRAEAGLSSTEKKGEIVNLKYQDQKVELNVTMKEKGWLVLKDNYYPGWEARVDGKQTIIYRGNYTMRAVFLEGGNHQVEFIYRPKIFKWGIIMTILGILVAIKLSWWSVKTQYAAGGKQ